MKKILVIGSLNMDLVLEVENMPLPGETIMGKSFMTSPGGKGANQAGSLGKLEAQLIMLGCVGNDSFGEQLLSSFSGVDTSRIKHTEIQPTGTAVIYVSRSGMNSIVVVPGANSECDIDYLKENDDIFRECDAVLLQMEIPHEAVYYAIDRAHELGKTVILNPAPAPDFIPDEILKKLDFITPNETELAKLTGMPAETEEEISAAAGVLAFSTSGHVLVTLGERGVMLSDGKTDAIFPTLTVPVVDTTAAGDCFNAAFVYGMTKGNSISQSIKFANVAAALSVSKKGAQSSLPTLAEVEAAAKQI